MVKIARILGYLTHECQFKSKNRPVYGLSLNKTWWFLFYPPLLNNKNIILNKFILVISW
jgi:hypothetical protein